MIDPRYRPRVSTRFWVGAFNGIALSIPIWALLALLIWVVCK